MTPKPCVPPRAQAGQSSMEYMVVCAALALVLGIGMADDSSVLKQLVDAFKVAYHKFSPCVVMQ